MVVVEDDGFIEFVRYITEDIGHVKLELPKRTHMRHEIVRFAEKLKRASSFVALYYSISTDIWTARNARSYISLTVHYVGEDFYPKSWTLCAYANDGGLIIGERYNTRILSDSESNVLKTTDLLGLEHMPCIAHTLHLIVAVAMIKANSNSSCDEVPIEMKWMLRASVPHFRTLTVYFRKSPKGRNRLGVIQIRDYRVESRDVLNLTVDCPTRWSSCCLMLQRLIYLESALIGFFTHIKSSEGLTKTKGSRVVGNKELGPVAKATRELGGQKYPTLPLVLPVISGIRKWLSREDLFTSHASTAGDELYVEETVLMTNECRNISNLEKSELKWISFLDPRVARQMPHLTPCSIPHACDELIRAAIEISDKERNTPFQSANLSIRYTTPVPAGNAFESFNMGDHI
ncbi:Zinc finger BED domain containing hypothetical protein 1-like [Phytophthora palmivora]|uniref:Uncharacterized protein n=1 Tax=Phytophthora palmivora TaxID=4796 RepID=A0A2P4Y9I4_9STRA|nr:Zinc finger BED domain containing hypothetical protein 1-like [Phytophthora palmivora]